MPSYVALPGPFIDERTQTGTSYTSPTWAAGTYRQIAFEIIFTAGGAGGVATITLAGGLVGSYDSFTVLASGASATPLGVLQAWACATDVKAAWSGTIDVRTAGPKLLKSSYVNGIGGTPIRALMTGDHPDTSNPVTGFVVTCSVSSTFTVTLSGVPA